ncbi:MAG: WD40/YVTN/BNR-like repeat-containing protein [Planctomycetota bacterium]
MSASLSPAQSFDYVHGGVGFGCETISDTHALFAYEGGVIRYTLDGGTTLINASVPLRVRDTLRSFHMGSDNQGSYGYCVGNNGVVLFSTDNGASWTELPKYRTPPQHPIAPNKAPELWDVWFEDRLHGYVVGFENTVIETFDGGQTWQDLSPSGHASFANPQWYRLHVFAPGEFVTTADNGWVLRVNNGAKAAFIINSSCYAPQIAVGSTDLQLYGLEFLGDEGIASGGIGNNDGYIYRSTDRGVSWTLDSSCLDHLATAGAPGTTPPTFYGLDLFGDVSRGVTVGYGSSCYIGGPSNAATAATGCPTCPSGSQAWTQVLCDSDQNATVDPFDDIGEPLLRDISSSPSTQVGFAIGDFGTLRRSNDQGATWTELSGLHRGRIECGAFSDMQIGVAAGQQWRTFSTVTGGQTFSLDYTPSIPINPATNKEYAGSMNAAAIADDGGRAVVCGTRGRVAVRDAAGTWHDRSVGTFASGPELTSALTVGNGSVMMLGGAPAASGTLHISFDGGTTFANVALQNQGIDVNDKVLGIDYDGRFVYYLTANRVYVADSLAGATNALGFAPIQGALAGSKPTCIGARSTSDFYVGNDRGQLFAIDLPSLTMQPVAGVTTAALGKHVRDCEPVPGSSEWFFGGFSGKVVRFDGTNFSTPKSSIADNIADVEFFGTNEGLLIGRKINVSTW